MRILGNSECNFTRLRFRRKLTALGLATAAACGLAIAESSAYARPLPSSGSDCTSGSVAARANKSYYGIAVPGAQRTGSGSTQDEISGLVCFKRTSPTRGTLQFRWAAVGRLQEGIFYYQVYDCTAHRTLRQHTKTMQYPNGSKSTHGQARAEVALNPNHTYAARVTGGGVYQRPHVMLSGAYGYFGPYPKGSGAPRFFDQSACT